MTHQHQTTQKCHTHSTTLYYPPLGPLRPPWWAYLGRIIWALIRAFLLLGCSQEDVILLGDIRILAGRDLLLLLWQRRGSYPRGVHKNPFGDSGTLCGKDGLMDTRWVGVGLFQCCWQGLWQSGELNHPHDGDCRAPGPDTCFARDESIGVYRRPPHKDAPHSTTNREICSLTASQPRKGMNRPQSGLHCWAPPPRA